MPELEQYRLFGFKGSDGSFLKKVGFKPCVICFPRSERLPKTLRNDRRVRPTEKDTDLVKQCGVAWEPKAGVQLWLGFCDREENAQET